MRAAMPRSALAPIAPRACRCRRTHPGRGASSTPSAGRSTGRRTRLRRQARAARRRSAAAASRARGVHGRPHRRARSRSFHSALPGQRSACSRLGSRQVLAAGDACARCPIRHRRHRARRRAWTGGAANSSTTRWARIGVGSRDRLDGRRKSDDATVLRRRRRWRWPSFSVIRASRCCSSSNSVTRFAHAARDVALAAGEPAVARGYAPSVFSDLPRLSSGRGRARRGAGSITAVFSVLVDGDDHNDPVADAMRGALDGHIVLDRAIADEGRYPAVNILSSVSRLAHPVWEPGAAQARRGACAR